MNFVSGRCAKNSSATLVLTHMSDMMCYNSDKKNSRITLITFGLVQLFHSILTALIRVPWTVAEIERLRPDSPFLKCQNGYFYSEFCWNIFKSFVICLAIKQLLSIVITLVNINIIITLTNIPAVTLKFSVCISGLANPTVNTSASIIKNCISFRRSICLFDSSFDEYIIKFGIIPSAAKIRGEANAS